MNENQTNSGTPIENGQLAADARFKRRMEREEELHRVTMQAWLEARQDMKWEQEHRERVEAEMERHLEQAKSWHAESMETARNQTTLLVMIFGVLAFFAFWVLATKGAP